MLTVATLLGAGLVGAYGGARYFGWYMCGASGMKLRPPLALRYAAPGADAPPAPEARMKALRAALDELERHQGAGGR